MRSIEWLFRISQAWGSRMKSQRLLGRSSFVGQAKPFSGESGDSEAPRDADSSTRDDLAGVVLAEIHSREPGKERDAEGHDGPFSRSERCGDQCRRGEIIQGVVGRHTVPPAPARSGFVATGLAHLGAQLITRPRLGSDHLEHSSPGFAAQHDEHEKPPE